MNKTQNNYWIFLTIVILLISSLCFNFIRLKISKHERKLTKNVNMNIFYLCLQIELLDRVS
jgi:hypothetical protein